MISGARAPISAATWARAASTRARAARPKLCMEAGLPKVALRAQAFDHARGDLRIDRRGRGIVEVHLLCGAHTGCGSGTGAPPPLLHGGEQAAQDVDLVAVQLGTLQEAADPVHEVGALLGAIAKVDLVQHLLQMRVQPLHGARIRERLLARRQRAPQRRAREKFRTPPLARPWPG